MLVVRFFIQLKSAIVSGFAQLTPDGYLSLPCASIATGLTGRNGIAIS